MMLTYDVIKTIVFNNTYKELFEKKTFWLLPLTKNSMREFRFDYRFGNFTTLIIGITCDEHEKRIISITNAAPKLASALTGATTKEVIQLLLSTQSGAATLGN